MKFHIGHLISVYTGRLVTITTPPIDGVYELLNFMANDNLFTNQLPRVAEEVRPYLAEQFPWLKEVNADNVNGQNWRVWLDTQIAKYGATFEVKPMHSEDHEVIDPISEFHRQRPDLPVITFDATEEPPISPTGDINWKV